MSEGWLGEAFEQLRLLLGGRQVTPRVPVGRAVAVPQSDTDDQADPDATRDESPSRGLFIVYRAEDGAVSQRVVTVRQLIGNPPDLMLAWCHLRQRPRHFRFDRIIEAVDPESGEVIAVEGLAARLQAEHGSLDRRIKQIVNVLVFIGRCDGSVVKAEWAAIDDSIADYMRMFGGDDETCRQACVMARQVAPDSADLMIALRSFAASAERSKMGVWLTIALKAVVDADGVHTREEYDWIDRITDIVLFMQR